MKKYISILLLIILILSMFSGTFVSAAEPLSAEKTMSVPSAGGTITFSAETTDKKISQYSFNKIDLMLIDHFTTFAVFPNLSSSGQLTGLRNSSDDFNQKLTKYQQNAIISIANLGDFDDSQYVDAYAVKQLMIWEVIAGYRNAKFYFKCSNSSMRDKFFGNNKQALELYKRFESVLVDDAAIPSFTDSVQESAPSIVIEKGIPLVIKDDFGVLRDFTTLSLSDNLSMIKNYNQITLQSDSDINEIVTFERLHDYIYPFYLIFDKNAFFLSENTIGKRAYVRVYTIEKGGFRDVPSASWFNSAVQYVKEKNLFHGTTETEFSPNQPMTRAMLITVLWRMFGSPQETAELPFKDINDQSYYYSALQWGFNHNIINGMSPTSFEPNGYITREQIATILYRTVTNPDFSIDADTVISSDSLNSFSDMSKISKWAKNGMSWCVNENLIQGTTKSTLDPSGLATRAQVATIIMRFSKQFMSSN